jgi:hypothetical protein
MKSTFPLHVKLHIALHNSLHRFFPMTVMTANLSRAVGDRILEFESKGNLRHASGLTSSEAMRQAS